MNSSTLEALDRQEEARTVLAAEGLFTTNRYASKVTHPAVAIERDSRLAAAKLFRELGLDVEPPRENRVPRLGPQRLRSRGRREPREPFSGYASAHLRATTSYRC